MPRKILFHLGQHNAADPYLWANRQGSTAGWHCSEGVEIWFPRQTGWVRAMGTLENAGAMTIDSNVLMAPAFEASPFRNAKAAPQPPNHSQFPSKRFSIQEPQQPVPRGSGRVVGFGGLRTHPAPVFAPAYPHVGRVTGRRDWRQLNKKAPPRRGFSIHGNQLVIGFTERPRGSGSRTSRVHLFHRSTWQCVLSYGMPT